MYFIYLLFIYLSIQELLLNVYIYKLKVFWHIKKHTMVRIEYLMKSTFFICQILIEVSQSKKDNSVLQVVQYLVY
jgi:hypothetical protein